MQRSLDGREKDKFLQQPSGETSIKFAPIPAVIDTALDHSTITSGNTGALGGSTYPRFVIFHNKSSSAGVLHYVVGDAGATIVAANKGDVIEIGEKVVIYTKEAIGYIAVGGDVNLAVTVRNC
jgi:hypothetical protein